MPYGTETEFCDIFGEKLKIGDYVAYSHFVITSGDFYDVGQCIYRQGKFVLASIHKERGCLDDFCVCNAKSIKIIGKQEALSLAETHEMQDIECLFGE